MDNKFLNYYNKELAFVRRLGAEFAKQHPKVAGNLRMSADTIEDPHVSRLIESVAFLNAGIRERLDDDYPQLASALLNVLYPHYLAPIPSMAIVQFKPKDNLKEKEIINQGRLIETMPINGSPVRFQTRYATELWPIEISQAKLYGYNQFAPKLNGNKHYPAVLQLSLQTLQESLSFAEIAPNKLRFFLKGTSQNVYALYELLMRDTAEIVLAQSPDDPDFIHLDKRHLKAVGFELDQGMLPYSNRSNIGFRLLSEFFSFPEKFLFFDIEGLTAENLSQFANKLHIYFYLKQSNKNLEQHINGDYFALGCTPVVNLFRKTTEPINWDHTKTEYPIVPDHHRKMSYEIFSIDNVEAIDPHGTADEFLPFYGIKHSHTTEAERFWIARRESARQNEDDHDDGTEMELSLVDLDMKPSEATDWVISVTTTCLNRDLPNQLPFGGGEPYLQFTDGGATVESITCLTAPTPTRRIPLGGESEWRLISHLSLNHISLMNNPNAGETLREILRLYDYTDSEETHMLINGIVDVTSKRTMARDPSGNLNTFCQGVEISVEFDENKFSGSSTYLFATVLERFFALYCSINSFTKLTLYSKGKRKVINQWQARSGEQTLI
jgi:type VI secretion system protein ImpG